MFDQQLTAALGSSKLKMRAFYSILTWAETPNWNHAKMLDASDKYPYKSYLESYIFTRWVLIRVFSSLQINIVNLYLISKSRLAKNQYKNIYLNQSTHATICKLGKMVIMLNYITFTLHKHQVRIEGFEKSDRSYISKLKTTEGIHQWKLAQATFFSWGIAPALAAQVCMRKGFKCQTNKRRQTRIFSLWFHVKNRK